MSAERTPFETFWIAKGASPGSLREIEAHARGEKERLRADLGLARAGFLPADAPIGAKTVFNQKRDLRRLAAIATAEGSAIPPGSWPDHVGLRESLGENVQALLDVGGQLPAEERARRRLTGPEADQIAAEHAREFIVERCEALDDAGADGPALLEAMVRDDPVPDVDGVDVAQLDDDLEEIADEFGLDLVTDAIAECRDRLAGSEALPRQGTEEILAMLRERFGVTNPTIEGAFAELEDRILTAERTGQEAALNRLQRGFGRRFDSIDDAVDQLRESIAAARGERLRFADVRVRRAGGDTRVFIDSDDPAFDQWRDNAERRVRRELDLAAITPPRTVTVGEITVRGETLESIDLTEGRERLGAIEEPQPLPEETPEREQDRLPEAETPVDELADRIISLGER